MTKRKRIKKQVYYIFIGLILIVGIAIFGIINIKNINIIKRMNINF